MTRPDAHLVLVLVLAGCSTQAPIATPCNADGDCPDGSFCAPGGCQLECREDVDCLGTEEVTTCDSRGRCRPPRPCASDGECQNALFCDGFERCTPSDASADERGCVAAVGPACGPDVFCDEEAQACDACREPDGDDDGFDAISCGGDDCDDEERRVHPGAIEVCDDDGVDEDCDPLTFGVRDRDADGSTSDQCCNTSAGGVRACGQDCSDDPTVDENAAQIHRTNPEICDGIDNDCDTVIDEGVQIRLYPDGDCDGYGADVTPTLGCDTTIGLIVCDEATGTVAWERDNRDCDDGDSTIRPGSAETCDLLDNDCNGSADEGCDCVPPASQACGGLRADGTATNVGACAIGTQTCSSGGQWGTCVGGVNWTSESCNGADDDCDGGVDEGVLNRCGACGAEPAEVCNFTRDEDCDGRIDESVRVTCAQSWTTFSTADWTVLGNTSGAPSGASIPLFNLLRIDDDPGMPMPAGAFLSRTSEWPRSWTATARVELNAVTRLDGTPYALGFGVAIVMAPSAAIGASGPSPALPESATYGYAFVLDENFRHLEIVRLAPSGPVVLVTAIVPRYPDTPPPLVPASCFGPFPKVLRAQQRGAQLTLSLDGLAGCSVTVSDPLAVTRTRDPVLWGVTAASGPVPNCIICGDPRQAATLTDFALARHAVDGTLTSNCDDSQFCATRSTQ